MERNRAGRAGRIRVLAALVIRETCTRFGRSWGGYLWAVLEPLGGVILLSAAFGFIVRSPPLGTSFELFYATGLIPFLLYSAVASGALNAIPANKGLLTYPVVSALDTILARTALEFLTHAVVAAVIFPGLILYFGLAVSFEPAALALSLLAAATLGLGVGTLNAVIAGFFPTWRQVWSVLNRPLFIVSGVLFTPDTVPEGLAWVVWLNPISHVIALMRGAFYGPEPALFADPAYLWALSLSLFAAGAFLMRRNEGRLIEGA